MTPKEGKEYFKACCEKLKINCDTVIKLGAGMSNDPKRFKYQSNYTKRKDTQLFAIKYFEKENVYIAWNLKERGGSCKNGFSLSKKKIDGLQSGQVLAASKGLGYPSWDAENTFAFKPDAVTRFLNTYVVPRA